MSIPILNLIIHKQMMILASPAIAGEIKLLEPRATTISLAKNLDFSLPLLLVGDSLELFDAKILKAIQENRARVLFVLAGTQTELPEEAAGFPIFCFLSRPIHARVLENMLHAALENMALRLGHEELEQNLAKAFVEIDELNKIGAALSAEHDTSKLLEMILQKSREITNSDAGALYLVEEDENTQSRVLRFMLTQNDSVNVPFNSFTIPIDKSRVSSYVALTGKVLHIEDAYNLPDDAQYGFSKDFDAQISYRTKSILAVPMRNHKGEVIGVLQLLNHKLDRNILVTLENADEVLYPYPERAQQLARSLASQAAMALENNRMIQDIQHLFEGFVQASVMAIEARDPTTSGHSFRVKKLTVALAEAVDRVDDGPYAKVKFTSDQLREISYASVLHDFGKVGVREHVLVKANKLYPSQFKILQQRFNYVRKAIQEDNGRKRLEYVLEKGREAYLSNLSYFDDELAARIKEVDDFLAFSMACNSPTVLPEGNFQRLRDIASYHYLEWDGHEAPLLNDDEIRFLSIPKGSLDDSERNEIESHVTHTFNFLAQIPWTRELRSIPEIARSHHEKLDGTGYPCRLSADEIPIQSKMMSISDIFDALSATDRPYKRALSAEKSLDIILSEVKRKLLDEELYRIFLTREIWKLTLPYWHSG
ncbi:HD-GYP domain-containing protein [Gammaproteobacteria bacterium]